MADGEAVQVSDVGFVLDCLMLGPPPARAENTVVVRLQLIRDLPAEIYIKSNFA